MPQKPWRQLVYILGEATLTLASSGVLFIIISRVSGPALLGTYALAPAWLMLFQGISSFGIPEFLMREVGMSDRGAGRQVLHAMVLGLGCGCLAVLLMLGAVRILGYPTDLVDVISIASLALIPAFLNTACRSVFLALRQMHFTFTVLLIEVTIVTVASLFSLMSGDGAIALMIALVAGKTSSACIALIFLYTRVLPVRARFEISELIQTAKTMFTFGIGNILGMLTMRINMIMVSLWVDIPAVGHFAAATKIMEVGLILPNLFSQLLMTRFAHSFNIDDNADPNRFGAWYKALLAFVVPVSVGGCIFARLILDTLFGPEFSNATLILRILMIYLLVESVDAAMSIILKAAYRQSEDAARLAFNPLVNIILNLLLLPTFGVVGAAIGRVGGVLASATLRYSLITQRLTTVNWFRYAMKPALASVAVGSVCYALFGLSRQSWLLVFYVVTTAILLRLSSSVSPSTIKDMMSFPTRQDEPANPTRD